MQPDKINTPRIKVTFSKKKLVAPESDGNIRYEDPSVENAIQEYGFGSEASKAAKENAMRIANALVGL